MVKFKTYIVVAAQLIALSGCNYLIESPVKLLTVESVANRFPAASSSFRTSIQNGIDEKTRRTDVEVLNGFPPFKMMLSPGGCANYFLPLLPSQEYIFVQPARKQGALYNDYCHKGKIVVTTKTQAKKTTFNCFIDPNDCSPTSCIGHIVAGKIVDSEAGATQVHLEVCNDQHSQYDAAIWELNLSSSNDTNKLKAVFGKDARHRLRNTANNPMSNTHLTMVTVVGDRGVGKSTITSLLSGNETMFKVGSSSTGTTTKGADMSAVIPSTDYANVIFQKLKQPFEKPPKALPFFLIDSEGMSVRGKSFDFATTSPPSVISKVVIWVGAENVQTARILDSLANYLEGLDQVILNDNAGALCQVPQFGHFIIVINKMMGTKTDSQLYQEIMTDEPDYIPGYEKRNSIRHKLGQCFASLTVHGLPVLPVPSGKDVTYADLNKRFQSGMANIVSKILESTLQPRSIPLGSASMEMNSTNAERIIATIIEEANKGKIDMTGFSAFWTSVSAQVTIVLDKVQAQLEDSSNNCETGGKVCSPCVCAYRNKVVQGTIGSINQILDNAKVQALHNFKIDATRDAELLSENVVAPWQERVACTSESKVNFLPHQTGICDSMILSFSATAGNNWNCNSTYICKVTNLPYTPHFQIETHGIYIDDGATFNLLAPPKAANGKNGQLSGQSGSVGAAGLKGTSLTIVAQELIHLSSNTVTVIARGGEGGNGGNGRMGQAGSPGPAGENGRNGVAGGVGPRGADNTAIPSARDPVNSLQVVTLGQRTGHEVKCYQPCIFVGRADYCCFDRNNYTVEWTDTVTGFPGGQGGNGGDGTQGKDGGTGNAGQAGGNGGNSGNGGEAGDVRVTLEGLALNIQKFSGAGGQGGIGASGGPGGAGGTGGMGGSGGPAGAGGQGGYGRSQHKKWTTGWNRLWPFNTAFSGDGTFRALLDSPVPCCQGQTGPAGRPGKNMPNGKVGAQGPPGANGARGSNGMPGPAAVKSVVVVHP